LTAVNPLLGEVQTVLTRYARYVRGVIAVSLIVLAGTLFIASASSAEDRRAVATWKVTGETFRTHLSGQENIAKVHQAIRDRAGAGIPIGRIYRGTQVNTGHRWHLRNVRLVEATIELCDGRPSDLDSNLSYWVDTVKRYCPWGAKPVRLRWVTP
jgi:hypothetical protein